MNTSKNKGDYILSIAATIQCFLVILQQCLIYIFHMDPEATTIYRVVLSAIPMIFAFYYILKRKAKSTFIVYAITLTVLLIQYIIFPLNSEYIILHASRFLLPIVIPTTLAVFAIKKIAILRRVLLVVSWGTLILAVVYVVSFLNGIFVIDTYNMGFSYGLLLPTLVLYTHKKKYSLMGAAFLFLLIISIGSRGAAIVIVFYILYDIIFNNPKYFFPLFGVGILSLLFITQISQYLSGIGIHSRTLSLFEHGAITQDSGRGEIYQKAIHFISESPILGHGLYFDRVFLNGAYCHNLFLEAFLNWGLPLGVIFFLILFYKSARVYMSSLIVDKNLLVILFFSSVIPLMVSGSYLDDYTFALFLGFLFRVACPNRRFTVPVND